MLVYVEGTVLALRVRNEATDTAGNAADISARRHVKRHVEARVVVLTKTAAKYKDVDALFVVVMKNVSHTVAGPTAQLRH